jgi:tetratricopeptide (TPR) repeat protein
MVQGASRGCEYVFSNLPGALVCRAALKPAAFTLLMLLALTPASAQQDAELHGRVRTDQGVALNSGGMVRLETEEHEVVAEQPVNTGGDFYFLHLPKRMYLLTLTAEGFVTYQQEIDLAEGPSQYNMTITLTPARKMAQARSSPPALSDAQAPKEARREYEKAEKALAARKLGEAREHLAKAVEQYPCYARAQTDLGMVFSLQQEYTAAEAALRKSLACYPGYVDASAELGQLLNAEKRFSEALPVLEQGARLSPGSWQFYYELGVAQYGLKHYSSAESEYLKAQSLNANPSAALDVKLADVYLRENAFDKAYAKMQEYLKAEPQGRFAPHIREIMKQMESSGVVGAGEAAKGPEHVKPSE